MKESWHKPKLVVLVRGQAEEAVLIACKAAGVGQSAPNIVGFECVCPGGPGTCTICEAIASS